MFCIYPGNLHYNTQTQTKILFQKNFVALLHRCSTVNIDYTDLQSIFWEQLWGQLLSFIAFVLVKVINNTFYWLTLIIYRPEILDWPKPFWRVSLFYGVFLEIISQLFAVIEAPIIFLFQSLAKQMFVVIAEAVPNRCYSKTLIWSIPVINVKRNNFINRDKCQGDIFIFIIRRYTF